MTIKSGSEQPGQLCDAHGDTGEKSKIEILTKKIYQIRVKRKRKSKNVEINYCASWQAGNKQTKNDQKLIINGKETKTKTKTVA